MARWTSKLTTVTISDGGSLSMTVGPGEGNLTIDNLMEGNAEGIPVYDRGVFDGMVEGQDAQQAVSITVQLEDHVLTDGVSDRILDAIRKTGAWAGGTTKDPSGTVWMLQLVVTMTRGATSTTITLPCGRYTASFAEAAEGHTLSISGTNYQTPVIA